MEGIRVRSSGTTTLALVAGLGCMSACGRVAAQSPLQVETVYAGERETPILGIALESSGPKLLLRGLGLHPTALLPVIGIAADESLVFSDGWSRYLRTRFDDSLAAPEFGQDPARVPTGWSLSLGARATLGWSTAEDRDGAPRAWLFAPGATRPLDLPESRVLWGGVDDQGQHSVLGLRGSTVLFDAAGSEALRLPAAARGRLARDGQWLALALELEGKTTLALVRTADGGTNHFACEPVLALAFDAAGTRLAAVSRRSARIFSLDGSAPKELLTIAAPAGQEWRNAAFDAAGRLALGGLRDVRRARRQGRDPAQTPVTARARIVVEVRGPALQTVVGEGHIDVDEWNSRSPELAFAPDGRLFVIVWPSGFEVLLP